MKMKFTLVVFLLCFSSGSLFSQNASLLINKERLFKGDNGSYQVLKPAKGWEVKQADDAVTQLWLSAIGDFKEKGDFIPEIKIEVGTLSTGYENIGIRELADIERELTLNQKGGKKLKVNEDKFILINNKEWWLFKAFNKLPLFGSLENYILKTIHNKKTYKITFFSQKKYYDKYFTDAENMLNSILFFEEDKTAYRNVLPPLNVVSYKNQLKLMKGTYNFQHPSGIQQITIEEDNKGIYSAKEKRQLIIEGKKYEFEAELNFDSITENLLVLSTSAIKKMNDELLWKKAVYELSRVTDNTGNTKSLEGVFTSKDSAFTGYNIVFNKETTKQKTEAVQKNVVKNTSNKKEQKTEKENVEIQTPEPLTTTKADKDEVKAAAIEFYKWYSEKWGYDPSNINKKLFRPEEIITGGKPDEEGGFECPCKVNHKNVDKYINWLNANAPVVSDKYKIDFKKLLADNEPKFKNTKGYDLMYTIQKIENRYNDFFYYIHGQDFEDDFDRMGFFNGTARWNIEISESGIAIVKTSFISEFYGKRDEVYTIAMIKQGDAWKLATPIYVGKGFIIELPKVVTPTATTNTEIKEAQVWIKTSIEKCFNNKNCEFELSFTKKYTDFTREEYFSQNDPKTKEEKAKYIAFEKKWSKEYDLEKSSGVNLDFLHGCDKVVVKSCEFLNQGPDGIWFACTVVDSTIDHLSFFMNRKHIKVVKINGKYRIDDMQDYNSEITEN